MLILETIFILVIITLICHYLYNYVQFRRSFEHIPGPKLHSVLLGNIPNFYKQMIECLPLPIEKRLKVSYEFFNGLFDDYRNLGVMRLWIGPFHPITFLLNANTVEQLLSSQANVNKSMFYDFLKPWLGDGLLLAEQKIWRPRRKLLTNAFHFKVLSNFITIFAQHTDQLLKTLENYRKSQMKTDLNENLILNRFIIDNVRLIYEDVAFKIINESAMDVSLDEKYSKFSDNSVYRSAMTQAFRKIGKRLLTPINWFDKTFKMSKYGMNFFQTIHTMNKYSDEIIQQRMKEYQLNNQSTNPPRFLDLLMGLYFKENPPVISLKSIRSEVNTFILGGHDTTALTLTFITLLLGHHQDVQDKAREEIVAILGEDTSSAENINIHSLKSLKYLEMCIKETLRLYPPAQIIGRKLTEPIVLKDNPHITIPANTECIVPIFYLHRDERYFPEPNRFNPERFENVLDSSFAFIPFSAGSRNCIGQKYAIFEVKYIMAMLLRKYKIRSLTNIDDICFEISPIRKPFGKISVEFETLS